jgi:4-hydroxy-4-methyl-2-oxoglutarate aldolase
MNKLSLSEILMLKRFNTPTVYNGWEQITKHDITKKYFNLEETTDFIRIWGRWWGMLLQ